VQLVVTAIAEGGAKSTNVVRLKAEPSTEPGLYEATYVARHAGAYRVDAIVADANGAEVGRAEAVGRAIRRRRNSARSSQTALCSKTSPSKRAAKSSAPPVWNASPKRFRTVKRPSPRVFDSALAYARDVSFALACFVAEWGVRRWKDCRERATDPAGPRNPKGLYPSAHGCEARATLGHAPGRFSNPERVEATGPRH